MTDDLAFASLREHRRLLRRGSLSARELVESCMRRIESIGGGRGAFEALDADRALREADSAQAALMAADTTGRCLACRSRSRLLQGTPSFAERVAALGIPVRVIWGADDRLWPIEAADGYRGLDNVQILRLEGQAIPP